jgi:hypothetical protein
MVIANIDKTSILLGLLVCALGISVSSSSDARKANRQGTYVEQGYPEPDAGHNSHAAQYAEGEYCLLDPLRSARRYCYGR